MTKHVEKLLKEWIKYKLNFCIFDCCDSMHEADRIEGKLEEYIGDKCPVDLICETPRLLRFYTKEVDDERFEYNDLDLTPAALPIPFNKIKHLVKRGIKVKK